MKGHRHPVPTIAPWLCGSASSLPYPASSTCPTFPTTESWRKVVKIPVPSAISIHFIPRKPPVEQGGPGHRDGTISMVTLWSLCRSSSQNFILQQLKVWKWSQGSRTRSCSSSTASSGWLQALALIILRWFPSPPSGWPGLGKLLSRFFYFSWKRSSSSLLMPFLTSMHLGQNSFPHPINTFWSSNQSGGRLANCLLVWYVSTSSERFLQY